MKGPVTIYDGGVQHVTERETQRKVFKNPRGLGYYYAFFTIWSFDLSCYKSLDGLTWADAVGGYITKGSTQSIWIQEDATNEKLIVHMTYRDDQYFHIMYRRLEIADAGSDISTIGAEVTVDDEDDNFKPMIFLGRQGYLHIVYEKTVTLKGRDYWCVWLISTDSTYPTGADPWTGASVKIEVYLPATEDMYSYPTGTPVYSGTHEGLIGYLNRVDWDIRGKYFDFNGTAHTLGDERAQVGTYEQMVSVVVDEDNYGHVCFADSSGVYVLKWTIDTGFGSPSTVISVANVDSCVIGIDKTSSPNKLIVFYSSTDYDGDVFYKTSPVDAYNWSSENTIDDDSEECDYLTCSYEDWTGDSKIQLIYTTQDTDLVRFVEVDLIPPVGWTGKISGVTDPAEVMGVAVANIAEVKGVP